MPRYVDTEKIPYYPDYSEVPCGEVKLFSYKEDIDNIPAADVQEVKHASYTKNDCCINCGSAMPTENKYGHIPKNEIIFCYHCGAKMNGKD